MMFAPVSWSLIHVLHHHLKMSAGFSLFFLPSISVFTKLGDGCGDSHIIYVLHDDSSCCNKQQFMTESCEK